jgi:hypothetical protein
MTAATSTSRNTRGQGGLKGLAGVLAFVCLVLFLMAIEQRQAVAAWEMVRDRAAPAVARSLDWARSGAEKGLSGLKAAASAEPPLVADPVDRVLAGEFAPADDATRSATGAANFIGALVRFESGEALRTRPLRIATGRERFGDAGPTFAARFDAADDIQVELRQTIPIVDGGAVAASDLCGGGRPGTLALLHRGDRVDLLLFREPAVARPGSDPALCGAWSYRAR